jgi:hypothetical protein
MKGEIHLGAHVSQTNHFEPIRKLTDAEIHKHRKYTPIFKEAENRLKLFQILRLNYETWKAFTDSLLQPRETNPDPMLIADQLLFNFLASAYGITEHFGVSFRQRFKKHPQTIKDYAAFVERLCDGSWAFAFFLDFRNYVQHVALPVGRYQKHWSRNHVNLAITQDAKTLLKEYRDWKRSKLEAKHGKLNLIDLSAEYYIRLGQDYGSYVANTFFPELVEMNAFYTGLTTETKKAVPEGRMVFFSKMKSLPPKLSFTVSQVANDVFGEIGIIVNAPPPSSPETAK